MSIYLLNDLFKATCISFRGIYSSSLRWWTFYDTFVRRMKMINIKMNRMNTTETSWNDNRSTQVNESYNESDRILWPGYVWTKFKYLFYKFLTIFSNSATPKKNDPGPPMAHYRNWFQKCNWYWFRWVPFLS